VIERVEIRRI